jgi:hypothetical protein
MKKDLDSKRRFLKKRKKRRNEK